ncbi:MAG: endonuclease/exonuclease/phosphatase family protein [Cellvibrionaceae bacterium]|nr:endonuclease/exonuclease/phosphatase family protein [Cellvibrionaceae bacterium]
MAINSNVKFATFNVSFAHDNDPTENFQQWVDFMQMPPARQSALIAKWKNQSATASEVKLAERIIQIRNVAAIIQKNRPDVLLLNEFNNDGIGEDKRAIAGFHSNYLQVAQSLNSVDGGNLLAPITYPFMESYATNTGLASGVDLTRNGYDPQDPNDAYGFGYYHGHYAFALFSKFAIDTENTRTFQGFKRKDLPGVTKPVVNVCTLEKPLPANVACGDNWFTEAAWQQLRLSSKNHVDAPIQIPTAAGSITLHVLLSHPTPPAFDTFSDNNKIRNSEENAFWQYYIGGEAKLYDDAGIHGGFRGDYFVIMGDLNADAYFSTGTDSRFAGLRRLMQDEHVHQEVSAVTGKFAPTSMGGKNEGNPGQHPFPQSRTSTFGARADYCVPSANLTVRETGVYWPSEGEAGRRLINDTRLGERGSDKEVSSDHRLVWVTIALDQ